jgi:uncharacterized protein (DUF58 family)
MSSLARYLRPEVIEQVRRLDLRAKFVVEGFLAGLHASPLQGFSLEFSEHRKYVHGDEPRSIDWNVFARTDRLYVRKYTSETHLACHLLIDVSASMGHVGPVGERSPARVRKLAYAIDLAAALGFLISRQNDAFGVGLIGEGLVKLIPARARPGQLLHALTVLARATARGMTGLAAGIDEALARIAHRGLIVLLSDLLTDPHDVMNALHQIRFRGHDLIVMHVLDAAEIRFPFAGQVRLEDPESGQSLVADAPAVRARYTAAVEAWRRELADHLAAMRADYVPLDTATPFDKALVEFLVQRSRRV